MDYTPIFKLHLPDFDYEPWDGDVNGNFSVIDAALSTITSVPGFIGLWTNSTAYYIGQTVLDNTDGSFWTAQVNNTSAATPTTFAQDRSARPGYWLKVVNSAQEYAQDAENAWTQFHSTWFGALSGPPTTDPYGNPLTAGDTYFDTGQQQLLVWTGTDWVGSTSDVIISANPPTSATQGELWWDSSATGLFVYYNGQWVETNGDLLNGGTISGNLVVTGVLQAGTLAVGVANYSTLSATSLTVSGSAYIHQLRQALDAGGNNITGVSTLSANTVQATGTMTAGTLVSTAGSKLAPLTQDLNANNHNILGINTADITALAATNITAGINVSAPNITSTSGSWLAPLQQNLSANNYNVTNINTLTASVFAAVIGNIGTFGVDTQLIIDQGTGFTWTHSVTGGRFVESFISGSYWQYDPSDGAYTWYTGGSSSSFLAMELTGGGNLLVHGTVTPGGVLLQDGDASIDLLTEIKQLRARIAVLEARS